MRLKIIMKLINLQKNGNEIKNPRKRKVQIMHPKTHGSFFKCLSIFVAISFIASSVVPSPSYAFINPNSNINFNKSNSAPTVPAPVSAVPAPAPAPAATNAPSSSTTVSSTNKNSNANTNTNNPVAQLVKQCRIFCIIFDRVGPQVLLA